MAGVDIRTIQELEEWKEIKMIERYAHLSQPHKVEASRKDFRDQDFTTVFTTHQARSQP